jgi:hypothetical protein
LLLLLHLRGCSLCPLHLLHLLWLWLLLLHLHLHHCSPLLLLLLLLLLLEPQQLHRLAACGHCCCLRCWWHVGGALLALIESLPTAPVRLTGLFVSADACRTEQNSEGVSAAGPGEAGASRKQTWCVYRELGHVQTNLTQVQLLAAASTEGVGWACFF